MIVVNQGSKKGGFKERDFQTPGLVQGSTVEVTGGCLHIWDVVQGGAGRGYGYLFIYRCRICKAELVIRGKFPGGNEPLGIFDDAGVMELGDMLPLEGSEETREGSNPSARTKA